MKERTSPVYRRTLVRVLVHNRAPIKTASPIVLFCMSSWLCEWCQQFARTKSLKLVLNEFAIYYFWRLIGSFAFERKYVCKNTFDTVWLEDFTYIGYFACHLLNCFLTVMSGDTTRLTHSAICKSSYINFESIESSSHQSSIIYHQSSVISCKR